MPYEPPIGLGLNAPAEPNPPPVESLQFTRAEHTSNDSSQPPSAKCAICSNVIDNEYFQVQGQVVCPACAARIAAGQTAPSTHSLSRALLYGIGAAIAGCAIYATVAIVTGYTVALVGILVGIMVGKSVRHGAGGRGGRPQQIMAVALTYLAISTSIIPIAMYHSVQEQMKKSHEVTTTASPATPRVLDPVPTPRAPAPSLVAVSFMFLLIGIGSPFIALKHGTGFISLFIILISLRQAWTLTARPAVIVMGPYQTRSS